MIIYSANKARFLDDILSNDIEHIVHERYIERTGRRVGPQELNSWKNSLLYVNNILADDDIPLETGVFVEYHIQQSTKRVDLLLSGIGPDAKRNLVLVELKQWSDAEVTEMDGIVRTRFQGGMQETSHPSYQAWSYATLLEGFHEEVYTQGLGIRPCAFLHNCEDPGGLASPFYREYVEKAPLFLRSDVLRLSEFIKRHVRHGDPSDLMYRIERGRIRPSKTIADAIAGMVDGRGEFVMIDDQKVVFEHVMHLVRQCDDGRKRVVIVRGGPGTGKSVVAVQLTAQLTAERRLVQYVSRNSAPREVYASRLSGYRSRTWVNNLFKGSGAYIDARPGEFDALVVDEAHRLNEKSGLYGNLGENQVGEIIRAARCAVFFLDEDQRVTLKDIGTREEIHRWARQAGADVHAFELESQFRCNGSDGYLAWLDDMLGIRSTAHPDLQGIDYPFEVVDDPNTLRQRIEACNAERNRARLVAGYCWPWNSKRDRRRMDIVIPEHGFEMQWNLTEDGMLWIQQPGSVHQVGCIHTCQGLEVDHIGVIIGDDMVVRDRQWVCRPEYRDRRDKSVHGLRQLQRRDPEAARRMADLIIKNTYRTLMTRGMKGCLVYSTDAETRDFLRAASRR